jgi:hypothetical protein
VPLIELIFVPAGMPVPWMVAPTTSPVLLETVIVALPLVSVQFRPVPVSVATKAID